MDARLRAILDRTRNADGAWPYLAGRQSRLEPTCWALLALNDGDGAKALAGWQTSAGLLVEPTNPSVNYAFNGLAALALARERADVSAGILSALVTRKGVRVAAHPAIKQDVTLQGWSWYEGTFSWVEPTAWCMLALKKLGHNVGGGQARIDEAERVLKDRACEGGGWNYGNTKVFGHELYAHVPPTAAGVLALQDKRQDGIVKDAISTLTREAPREGSSTALSLAWLALSAVGSSTGELSALLRKRAETAENLGNVASLAMMSYVLDLSDRGARPAALTI